MIDQDFSGADQLADVQDASSYHFINSGDPSTVQDQKQPLDFETKTSYDQFQHSRQAYQAHLAPYSDSGPIYPSQSQYRSYDGPYPPTNPAAVVIDAPQAVYTPDMAPLARTTSDTSEPGPSTAEGLSEVLGELKIDESGTGEQTLDLERTWVTEIFL